MKQLLETHAITGGGTATLYLEQKPYLNFGGNNYLALNDKDELRNAAQEELAKGSGYSMFLPRAYGARESAFEAVEKEACLFFDQEAAVYLPSGYFIGHAALTGLRPKYDVLILDELAHWCIWDAAKLAEVPIHTFKHCDTDDLQRVLKELPLGQRPLIGTDGVFATMGNLPQLNEYANLAKKRDGIVFVDESHAIGVVGTKGRGTHEHFECGGNVFFGATLSKGLCAQGAVFVGDYETVERAQKSTVLRGSSKGSPISASVSAAALRYVRTHPEQIAELGEKTKFLRNALRNLGLHIADSPAPIVSFSHGDFETVRGIQVHLFENNIYVLHSNYIAAGVSGALRCSVFGDHTYDQLNHLVTTLKKYLEI